jgi:hypothetical protein
MTTTNVARAAAVELVVRLARSAFISRIDLALETRAIVVCVGALVARLVLLETGSEPPVPDSVTVIGLPGALLEA